MSYTPTNWQTGDTVTAERLNKMEGGIQAALDPFIITCTPTNPDYSGTTDTTMADIVEAYNAGRDIWFYAPAFGLKSHANLFNFVNDSIILPHAISVLDIDDENTVLCRFYVGTSGTLYGVKMYPLTPMS